jgi:hypothetical protein
MWWVDPLLLVYFNGRFLQGDQFELIEGWGEGLDEVRRPLLCVVDFGVSPHELTVLDDVVKFDVSPQLVRLWFAEAVDNFCALFQAIWSRDSRFILFVGLSNLPFRLGKASCDNRRYFGCASRSKRPFTLQGCRLSLRLRIGADVGIDQVGRQEGDFGLVVGARVESIGCLLSRWGSYTSRVSGDDRGETIFAFFSENWVLQMEIDVETGAILNRQTVVAIVDAYKGNIAS